MPTAPKGILDISSLPTISATSSQQMKISSALAPCWLTGLGKPPVFSFLLRKSGESGLRAREVGARIGQLSEFSLLIAVLALQQGRIGLEASYLIQLATLLTFFASTYAVILKYPTPIALSDELRRD